MKKSILLESVEQTSKPGTRVASQSPGNRHDPSTNLNHGIFLPCTTGHLGSDELKTLNLHVHSFQKFKHFVPTWKLLYRLKGTRGILIYDKVRV